MSYRDVYGEILADHHESPRNWGKLSDATQEELGYNPLCGDRVMLFLKLNNDQVEKCAFEGEGCSICMASASIMTEMVSGHSKQEVEKLIQDFRDQMQGKEDTKENTDLDTQSDIVALYGVKRFPVRIKCALLPWTTLKKGLEHGSA